MGCPPNRQHSLLLLFGVAFPLVSVPLACGKISREEKVPRAGNPSPETSRAKALILLRRGEPREAMDLLLTSSHPGDPDDAFLLGEAALRCGRYTQAEKAYREVLRSRPEDLKASTHLARIAFLEARYSDARSQLDWILARSPDDLEARELRARIRLRLGDLNGAATDARRWADLAPRQAEPLRILGVVQRQRRDPAGAVEVLKRAVALDPSHLPSRLDLARVYAEAGQKGDSDRMIREAGRLEREQREAARRRVESTYYRARALKMLEAGDPVGALKNFEDALARNPDDPDLFREAGETALKAGDSERGLRYMNRSVELAPSNALARRIRGEIALARKDPEGALADLLEAARLDPTDPQIHRELARAYQALHRPEAEKEAAIAADLEKKGLLPPPAEVTP